MAKVSNRVNAEIHALYALMAQAAAKKAVARIVEWDDYNAGVLWAERAEECLIKAGADATRWSYERPKVQR